MHFSRSSEVLYFHSEPVSVHTDSHTDLERYVVASWVVYTYAEYKASMRVWRGEGRVSGVSLVGYA